MPAGPCSALSPRDDVRTRGGAAVAEATAEQSARSCALLASRGRHVAATDKVSAPGPAPSALPCAGELGAGCLRAFHVSLLCETFLVRESASFQEPMVLNTLPFYRDQMRKLHQQTHFIHLTEPAHPAHDLASGIVSHPPRPPSFAGSLEAWRSARNQVQLPQRARAHGCKGHPYILWARSSNLTNSAA